MKKFYQKSTLKTILTIWPKNLINKKKKRSKDNIICCVIVLLLITSCKKHSSTGIDNCVLDSIEVYNKYEFSTTTELVQSKIVYYYETRDTITYLQTGRLLKFLHSDGYKHIYLIMDDSGYSLQSIISLNSDILNFKRALLLNEKKQVVDTLINNNAKMVLYLDNKKIAPNDSISMNKTIPIKIIEKHKLSRKKLQSVYQRYIYKNYCESGTIRGSARYSSNVMK